MADDKKDEKDDWTPDPVGSGALLDLAALVDLIDRQDDDEDEVVVVDDED